MQTTRAILATLFVISVAGCAQSTDTQRAVIGGIAGAAVADVMDENVLTGAAIGAAGGAVCDDLNVIGCN